MKIYPVIYMSRIVIYQAQVKEQKKIPLLPIEIDRKKKCKVEKILNKRDMRTLVKEFEKEIREEEIRRV